MTDKKKPGEIRARLEQANIDRRQQDEASMRSRGIYLSDNERADLQAIDDNTAPCLTRHYRTNRPPALQGQM